MSTRTLSKTLLNLALFSSIAIPYAARAHSVTGALGSVEVLPPGHYHLDAPFVVDMEGNFTFESPLGDEHHHEEGGEPEEGEEHPHGEGLEFTVILNGDFDGMTRKVVKTKNELAVDSWSVGQAREQDERWLYTNQKWSFGAGPELHHEPVGFGLIPGVETSVFHRTACENPQCDQTGIKKLPEDLAYWRGKGVGERISYSKGAGVHVHLPIGPHGVPSFALAAVLETSWQISIEKTMENQLTIKAGRDKVGVAGGEIDAILASAGLSRIQGKDLHFDFNLDLNHPEAEANYARFLKGRIDLLQEMAEQQNGVKFISRGDGTNVSRSATAMVGIPVLSGIGVESAKTSVSSVELGYASNATVIQKVVRARGVLSKHLMRGHFTVANVQRLIEADPNEPADAEPYFDLSTLWLYEKDKTTDERIEKWLHDLSKSAALPELERFIIDDQIDGYMRAEVRVRFTPQLILGWLGIDGQGGNSVKLPETLAKAPRWQTLRDRALRAFSKKDDKKLSEVLASSVSFALKNLEGLRREWMKTPPEFPVFFNVAFSGESLPNTTKNWKISK